MLLHRGEMCFVVCVVCPHTGPHWANITVDSGRNPETGQFLKGHHVRGNPYQALRRKFRELLYGTLSDDEIKAEIMAMHNLAVSGEKQSVNACRLLWEYAFGKPQEIADSSEEERHITSPFPVTPQQARTSE